MGLYRNHLAAIQHNAFSGGEIEAWDQSAPKINNRLSISSKGEGPDVDDTRAHGSAVIELLEGPFGDLGSSVAMSYELDAGTEPLSGFFVRGHELATPDFNKMLISDEHDGEVMIFLDGEPLPFDFSVTESGLIAAGVATVFAEKFINVNARNELLTNV